MEKRVVLVHFVLENRVKTYPAFELTVLIISTNISSGYNLKLPQAKELIRPLRLRNNSEHKATELISLKRLKITLNSKAETKVEKQGFDPAAPLPKGQV